MNLEEFRLLLETADAGTLWALDNWRPVATERAQAAAIALQLGRPRLAAEWAEHQDVTLRAAALLRLGERRAVLEELEGQPETARVALLRARALGTLEAAGVARTLARREGDGPALIAAATLLGELLLPTDPRAALRALAEGLKVSEVLRQEADAHLLAVLSLVQGRVGGRVGDTGKARKTAQKALERSYPRSPERVLALLSLGRIEEAEAERAAGELALRFETFLPLPL
ncbi:hypothetical protein [Deinococcus sp.]|uniref:hypothetical protein n=1 Tax=Deinococcus sp. TaxID=47478 RepID=UPI003C7C9A40